VLADGRLASASWDNTIRLWDVATGTEIVRLHGHQDGINALCVLADGRLASGSNDNTIRLWDSTTGSEIAPWMVILARSMRCAHCPTGGSLQLRGTTQSGFGTLPPDETARLDGHTNSVEALCMLPDGRLASGSCDNTIRLWDPATGAETAHLGGHTGWVKTLCVLADGRLASGAWDHTVRLWDSATGFEITRLEVDAPVTYLAALTGTRLVAGDRLGRLHWLELLE
jgi:WD40 repeat protein